MSKKNNRIIALIQARMGSTRLPGKVLSDLSGRPVIWHIWNRLRSIPEINEIVVATSIDSKNDILEEYCNSEAIPCFRGSENEVLDRFYKAAQFYKADAIIRITGDCPLIDPFQIGRIIEIFLKSDKVDYVSLATGAGVNKQKVNKFPDGTDAEVISFKAIQQAWSEAKNPVDRGEAVTSYIWRNKDLFRSETVYCDRDLGHLRWTLDHQDDLEFVRKVYKRLYSLDRLFTMWDVVKLIEAEPELIKVNENWIGKENYDKYYDIN